MDITENDLLKRLGDVANEGYFVFSLAENKFVYLSDAFKQIWNLPETDGRVNAELFWQLIYPDDIAYIRECLAALKRGEKIKAELRILPKAGMRYVEVKAYPMDSGGMLVGGCVADITDMKNNIFYAEKINARKNAMLAVLAHDLKEPVAVINMMASAIKSNSAVAGNTAVLNNIQVIEDLCARNITLIKDLMQKEFLESPEVGLRMERLDMVKSVGDIVKQYKDSESVIVKQFAFTHDKEQVYAVLDMLKIAQCVNNLIVNAIKFTPPGGLIEVTLTEQADTVQLAVSDNGIGIPEELKPYLFEHRTRAHRPGLRDEEGAGIGLSIIRLLVELHGGKVWVHSEEGKGSTFYIELPKGL